MYRKLFSDVEMIVFENVSCSLVEIEDRIGVWFLDNRKVCFFIIFLSKNKIRFRVNIKLGMVFF